MNKRLPANNFIYATSQHGIVEIQVQVDPNSLLEDGGALKRSIDNIQLQLSRNENPWKDLGVPDYVAKAKQSSIDESATETSSTASQSHESMILRVEERKQVTSRLPPSSDFMFIGDPSSRVATTHATTTKEGTITNRCGDIVVGNSTISSMSSSSIPISSEDSSVYTKKRRTDV